MHVWKKYRGMLNSEYNEVYNSKSLSDTGLILTGMGRNEEQ
jgi:hypothetical protein